MLSIMPAVLVLALRPAARSLVEVDFTFLVIAPRAAPTLRRAEDALRLNLLIADARLLPLFFAAGLLPPRLAPPLEEDFFADRFALAAITAPFGLNCDCVLTNSLSLGPDTMKPLRGFISGWHCAVKCPAAHG